MKIIDPIFPEKEKQRIKSGDTTFEGLLGTAKLTF